MFLCRDCVKDKDEFDYRISKSKGPCENCGYTDICIDARVAIDPKWKTNVNMALKKAGLDERIT